MSFLWRFVTPQIIGVVLAVIAAGGGLVWFKANYVPKSEVKAVEVKLSDANMEIDLLNETVHDVAEKLAEQRELYEAERKRVAVLNRHWDAVRDRLREIDDDESTNWRNTRVPGPIVDGLRQASPDTN